MGWTEEKVAQLRTLWEEGLSTAEIGRRLGISKNAVIGKAHRLQLAARPSPIRRETQAEAAGISSEPRPRRRRQAKPLPPAAGAEVPARQATSGKWAEASGQQETRTRRPASPAPAKSAPSTRFSYSSTRSHVCCWPIGDPGKPGFRFCDAEVLPGKPYCAEHAGLAYVRLRDRREEAA
jgi:GcrA cell cycle regulator